MNGLDSGGKCDGSLAKYDPATSSWRTAQCSLFGGLDEFSGTWPRWGMMLHGECWERVMSERPTNGNESGFWPTPRARPAKAVGEDRMGKDAPGYRANLEEAIGGPTNPDWQEWLMGWPCPGWTELKPLATDKFRLWLLSHGKPSTDS